MHFNRPDADVELFSDFSIRVALGHESKNFFLTIRQRGGFFGFVCRSFFGMALAVSRNGFANGFAGGHKNVPACVSSLHVTLKAMNHANVSMA